MSLKAIATGQKTVATAGTQLPLTAAKTIAKGLKITALAGNAGVVYIGDANVDSTTGIQLAAGASLDVGAALAGLSQGGDNPKEPAVDLNAIFVDAATNGDKVSFVYWTEGVQ